MVRRCIAKECKESDISILSHRFPKTLEIASKWQKALKLDKYSINDLQKKFVVCTKHFSPKSYRNEISNSLNTTAIPNLNDNEDNERILTTDPSVKKQQTLNTPARCHKLPPTFQKHKLENSPVLNHSKIKLIKLGANDVNQYLNVKVIEEDNQLIEEIVPSDDVEETFEICEITEDRIDYHNDVEEEEIVEPEEPVIESEEIVENLEPEIIQCVCNSDQETQTDSSPEVLANRCVPNIPESKDDKLIKLLYPEFSDFNKIQLIELVNERDRKVEALEEKIKKLELAMRNLL
jgi:THAP domain